MIGDSQARQSLDDATARLFGRFLFPETEEVAQQLQHGLKWGAAAVSKSPGFKDPNALCPAILCEFETQAALADPGFTDDTNHAAITPEGAIELDCQRGRLFVSTG